MINLLQDRKKRIFLKPFASLGFTPFMHIPKAELGRKEIISKANV